jgi:hypothetical protein
LDNDQRVLLLLSAQRALLGAVTPNIRAIRCTMKEKLVSLEFIFDSDYSDEDWDRCETVAAEIIGDFHDEVIDTKYQVIPPPARIPQGQDWLLVYQRFE